MNLAGHFHPGPDPRSLVVGSAAAAALSLAAAAAAATRGALPFLVVLGLLGLASFAYLAWHVDPAWTLTGSVALSVFGGYWGELGPLGYLPVTPDRLMLLAGAGALLLRAPGARDRESLRLEPVHWLLLGAIAFAVVSALVSGTLLSKSEFFRLFDRFGVAPFLMFTLAPLAFPTEGHRKIFLGVLVALGGYLGLTALFETVGPQALVFPHYITNPELGFHVGRARGPFSRQRRTASPSSFVEPLPPLRRRPGEAAPWSRVSAGLSSASASQAACSASLAGFGWERRWPSS